jgi:hypothetical protein
MVLLRNAKFGMTHVFAFTDSIDILMTRQDGVKLKIMLLFRINNFKARLNLP